MTTTGECVTATTFYQVWYPDPDQTETELQPRWTRPWPRYKQVALLGSFLGSGASWVMKPLGAILVSVKFRYCVTVYDKTLFDINGLNGTYTHDIKSYSGRNVHVCVTISNQQWMVVLSTLRQSMYRARRGACCRSARYKPTLPLSSRARCNEIIMGRCVPRTFDRSGNAGAGLVRWRIGSTHSHRHKCWKRWVRVLATSINQYRTGYTLRATSPASSSVALLLLVFKWNTVLNVQTCWHNGSVLYSIHCRLSWEIFQSRRITMPKDRKFVLYWSYRYASVSG